MHLNVNPDGMQLVVTMLLLTWVIETNKFVQ